MRHFLIKIKAPFQPFYLSTFVLIDCERKRQSHCSNRVLHNHHHQLNLRNQDEFCLSIDINRYKPGSFGTTIILKTECTCTFTCRMYMYNVHVCQRVTYNFSTILCSTPSLRTCALTFNVSKQLTNHKCRHKS